VRLVSPDPLSRRRRFEVGHTSSCTLQENAYDRHIVVVDYQPATWKKLSWTLRSLEWVDFQQDFADGCRKLLRIWGRGYKEPLP
jgi:hypothetical protein